MHNCICTLDYIHAYKHWALYSMHNFLLKRIINVDEMALMIGFLLNPVSGACFCLNNYNRRLAPVNYSNGCQSSLSFLLPLSLMTGLPSFLPTSFFYFSSFLPSFLLLAVLPLISARPLAFLSNLCPFFFFPPFLRSILPLDLAFLPFVLRCVNECIQTSAHSALVKYII